MTALRLSLTGLLFICLLPIVYAEISGSEDAFGNVNYDYSNLNLPSDFNGLSSEEVRTHIENMDQWPSGAAKGLTAEHIKDNLDLLKGKEFQLDADAYGGAVGDKIGVVAEVDTSQGGVGGEVISLPGVDGGGVLEGMSFERLPRASFALVARSL